MRSQQPSRLAGLEELPGGHVEDNESLEEALIRKLREETGLTVTYVKRSLGSFDYVFGSDKRTWQWNFLVEVEPGDVQLNPNEHDCYAWVSQEDVGKHHLSSAIAASLQQFFINKHDIR